MKYLINRLRRDAEDALNHTGMEAGLTKARVDAGQLKGLCDRAEQLLKENERLNRSNNALRKIATDLKDQIAEYFSEVEKLRAENEQLRSALCRVIEKLSAPNRKYARRIYKEFICGREVSE